MSTLIQLSRGHMSTSLYDWLGAMSSHAILGRGADIRGGGWRLISYNHVAYCLGTVVCSSIKWFDVH